MVFQTWNLRNNLLIESLSKKSLIFLDTYQTVPQFGHSERELLITERRRNIGTVAKPN
jgi:hypothetical protein